MIKTVKILYYKIYGSWKNLQSSQLVIDLDNARVKRRFLLFFRINFKFWIPLGLISSFLLVYPVSSLLRYQFIYAGTNEEIAEEDGLVLSQYELELEKIIRNNKSVDQVKYLPSAKSKKEETNNITNRIIIEKIGVDTGIIENDDAKTALSQGVWRIPITSNPFNGGNMVLTAHRYKFLPPSKKTFYLLDKLEIGDRVEIIWQGKSFIYQVNGSKIVSPKDVSALENTKNPILTLITCTPLFSSENRLIITADLVDI